MPTPIQLSYPAYVDNDTLTGDGTPGNRVRVIGAPSVMPVVNIRDFGAKGDGVTDDTAAIQRAVDHAHDIGGLLSAITAVQASPTPYMVSNLKLWNYTTLMGSRIGQCVLKRIPGSTGPMITEYTVAEGNTDGARGIWLSNLGLNGNGTVGDGVVLGYQNPGIAFETWGSIEKVLSFGFTSGLGFDLNANAISLYWLYALGNRDGARITGADSQFHTVYAEANSRYQLRAAGVGHSFFGVHVEPGASADPAILVEGISQSFRGTTAYLLSTAYGNVIEIASGATKNQLHDTKFTLDGGATMVNGIFPVDASNGGTGTDTHIQHYECGEDANVSSWYVNLNSNIVLKRKANIAAAKQADGSTLFAIGDDTASVAPGQNGVKLIPFSDGNNYIDSKAKAGGTTVFRCGAGAETGSARTWMALTNANGNVNLPAQLSAAALRVGGVAGPLWLSGAGSPEGAVVAPVGSIFSRTDGGAATSFYVKEAGAGNTGWVAK